MTEWQVEGLRVTAFSHEPIDQNMVDWWAEITGEQPSLRQSRPRDQVLSEGGPYLDAWLALDVSPMRVDWRLIANPNEPPAELPVIGSFNDRKGDFVKLVERWLRKSPKLKRLAFGAVLLFPVKSAEEGYKKLDVLLPAVKIDAKNASDFSYRINRRRKTKGSINGLEINRLSSWALSQIMGVQLQLAAENPRRSRALEIGETIHACRLELDINTVPDVDRVLKKSAVPKLLRELVDLGTEIAQKGDVP